LLTVRLFHDSIANMTNTDQIRPLTDVPDHGFGLLGGLAHSVLAEYTGTALPVPRLHLGQNTLPNPPFPMAAQVPFGDLTEGWLECGEDLTKFLEMGARALRAQPIPEISAYSQQVRILQRVLRFDAIAMVLADQMIWSAESVAHWALAADVLARRRDAPGSAVARPTMVGCAVDRAGNALLGWFTADGTPAGIEITGGVTTDDKIVTLLRDVLLAQYAWTSACFGEVPLPAYRPSGSNAV
jgi:hypothetical protein